MKILLLDNYDSFTYNLAHRLREVTGQEIVVVRNDAITATEVREFSHLVLSPGPEIPSEAGRMMEIVSEVKDSMPILGVCLGHQAMGEFFGARLLKSAIPMHGKTSHIQHNGHWLFTEVPETFQVMRYHSLILDSVENLPFDSLASTSSGEIMAISHKELPLLGLQFHPESILSEHGLLMLQNWINSIPTS